MRQQLDPPLAFREPVAGRDRVADDKQHRCGVLRLRGAPANEHEELDSSNAGCGAANRLPCRRIVKRATYGHPAAWAILMKRMRSHALSDDDAQEPPMPSPSFAPTSLTKIVQSGDEPLTILDDVTFDVAAGATIAIVGACGSGKTTLLGLAGRARSPDVGRRDHRRRGAVDARRGRARGIAPAPARLRVPVVPAAAGADGARERDAAARARRRDGRRSERARVWLARVGLARAHDALSAAAVRRRAAARRDRARIRRRAEDPDGRRADRQPRRRDGHRGGRSDVPPQSRARHDAVLVTHDVDLAVAASAAVARTGTAGRRRARRAPKTATHAAAQAAK